jgi:hypothetical protein
MVLTLVILAPWEIGRIMVCGQPGQKVSKTPNSTNTVGMVAHAYYPSYSGSTIRSIVVQTGPGKNEGSYSKNN